MTEVDRTICLQWHNEIHLFKSFYMTHHDHTFGSFTLERCQCDPFSRYHNNMCLWIIIIKYTNNQIRSTYEEFKCKKQQMYHLVSI